MRLLAIFLLLAVSACATSEWDRVRSKDSADEYRRFAKLRPDSPYRDEALERADFLEIRDEPKWEDFEQFRDKYPASAYVRRLAVFFEEESYERARRIGTASAYQEYLQTFGSGQRAENARAALEYLQNDGFANDPRALGAFIRRYPNSDYGAEARRALEMLQVRQGKRFRRIGMRIEIDASVASPDRVKRTFTQRAKQAYAGTGIGIVSGTDNVDAWITIRHSERPTKTQVTDGTMLPPGVMARTELLFNPSISPDPIFREEFSLRVSNSERRADTSVLFSPRSPLYWSQFFIPVASWPTQLARRGHWKHEEGPEDIDAAGDRAVALFRDGSFRALAVADPTNPSDIAHYRAPQGLTRYDGVRRYANAIVAFGEDGLRILVIDGDGNAGEVANWERGDVGAVRDVARSGQHLLIVSSRGLLRAPLAGGEVEALISGKLRGVAQAGRRLFLIDEHWLYVASPKAVSLDGLKRVARFERGFEPEAVHVSGGLIAVEGAKEVMCIAIGGGRSRVLSRFQHDEVGEVQEAALLGGRVFLLGTRGLQVGDPRTGLILDAVDVDARKSLSATGRLLVAGGEVGVQLVDATPWMLQAAPASQ